MSFFHLKEGLREIVNNYEIFSIDLWGVVHNGISLNSDAIEVLDNLKKENKKLNVSFNLVKSEIQISGTF